MATERELILAKREAFERALEEFRTDLGPKTRAARAREFYSLPKVSRPRVVRDASGAEWCVKHLKGFDESSLAKQTLAPLLHWRCEPLYKEWRSYPMENGGTHYHATIERCAIWTDLLQNPNEMVDESETQS